MDSKAKVPAGNSAGYYNDERLSFNWNDDVLMEILLSLPAKSIARFKSVCKHWLSLVSSAEFCHLHTLRRLKLLPSLILEMPVSQFFYFDPIMNGEKQMVPYNFSVPNPRIVSSCNGLMLLRSDSDYRDNSFHVYNPTTKCSRKISFTDTHSDNEPHIVALALAFDPSEWPHYKVVCIRRDSTYSKTIRSYQIEVYDSESRTWKLSLGPFTFHRVLFPLHRSVYWNGSIYWEILYEIGNYDIAKNEFKTLSLPNYPLINYQRTNTSFSLQVANGHLYHSRLTTKGNCQSITLFELEMDDRCSWLLKYHGIVSRHEPTSTSSFDSCASQLRFIKGSYGIETCSVVSHLSGKISVYSFLDKSYKLLIDLTGPPFSDEDAEDSYLEMYEYHECLALV